MMTNSQDYWIMGDVFFRVYYTIWDDDANTLTVAPKKDGVVTSIPRTTVDPIIITPPGERNVTSTYDTGMSAPYIGLYTMVGIIGAEGLALGLLFGFGVLTLKASKNYKK